MKSFPVACRVPGTYKFKTHIETYKSCFDYYKSRFKVQNWDELKAKLLSLERPSYSSRSSLKRKLDNAEYSARKRERKSVTDSLNTFRQKSALSNHKLCVVCQQFYLNCSVSEVNNTNPLYEELELSNKKNLSRMGQFWICQVCQSSENRTETSLVTPMMKRIETEGWQILYPVAENIQDEEFDVHIDKTLVFVPYNGYNCGNKTEYQIPNIYRNPSLTNSLISTLYHNRQTKFALRKLYADLYDGEISSHDNKKLDSISKILDESNIRSSSSWKQKQKRSIVSQFTQYGGASLAFSINVPISTIESVVTSDICNGAVVTVQFDGNSLDEFRTKYFSHNHGNDTTCASTNCIKTEIKQVDATLETRCIPNFISSIYQKQTLFIEQFVRNQNFELFAEEYFCGIHFSLSGNAKIYGLLWTHNCSVFNRDLSQSSLTGNPVEKKQYLQYIENSILCTVNHLEIQEFLQIPKEEAIYISSLAKQFQINMEMPEKDVKLPSYETLMRVKPEVEAINNTISAKRMMQKFKQSILNLTEEEKKNLTSQEWLTNISSKAKFTLQESEVKLVVQFDEVCVTFVLEGRLNQFIDKYGPFIGMK